MGYLRRWDTGAGNIARSSSCITLWETTGTVGVVEQGVPLRKGEAAQHARR